MKFRTAIAIVLAVLVASFGVVSAQHGTDHSTPESHDHADQSEHSGHNMDDVSLGAFYFTLSNNGDEADTLLKVETEMADVVEVHNVEMDDGVMKMVPLHDGLEIAPGEEIVFEPGGYHVMMIGITASLLDGDEFTATLHFEHAGEVEITVPIHALEPDSGDQSDPVEAGDIEISNIWARQAPKLDGMATPIATPDATPGH